MRAVEAPVSEVGLALCRIIKDRPGIHFRGLARAAHVTSAGQLRHHIDRLKRQGRIVEVQDGRYKRFFMAGHHDPNLRPGLARFSRPVPRQIGRLLLNRPMNRTELRRSLGCADSTLGYHLKRMVQMGDLEKARGRNCCRYTLRDQELVRRVLMMQDEAANAAAQAPPDPVILQRQRTARSPRRWSPTGVAATQREDGVARAAAASEGAPLAAVPQVPSAAQPEAAAQPAPHAGPQPQQAGAPPVPPGAALPAPRHVAPATQDVVPPAPQPAAAGEAPATTPPAAQQPAPAAGEGEAAPAATPLPAVVPAPSRPAAGA
ncbi:MAG TPA: hypothetical protein VFH47_01395 [Candidatus Thermoplasmatota archaeon]|nr:hypothetical protein [Candidatus Thermoplasmatota archaeon]